MLNENAKKWVAALRSGEYKQCTKQLADGKGYCCLGVACEVAIANGLDVQKVTHLYGVCFDEEAEVLPERVQEWLGLRDSAGDYYAGDKYICLTALNDRGYSFDKLADIIESEPEGLFSERKVERNG